MNNAFDELISRLDMAEEGISEFKNMSTGTCKTEKQREKELKKKRNKTHRISKNMG